MGFNSGFKGLRGEREKEREREREREVMALMLLAVAPISFCQNVGKRNKNKRNVKIKNGSRIEIYISVYNFCGLKYRERSNLGTTSEWTIIQSSFSATWSIRTKT